MPGKTASTAIAMAMTDKMMAEKESAKCTIKSMATKNG